MCNMQLYTFKCEVLLRNSIVDASTVSYKGQFENRTKHLKMITLTVGIKTNQQTKIKNKQEKNKKHTINKSQIS